MRKLYFWHVTLYGLKGSVLSSFADTCEYACYMKVQSYERSSCEKPVTIRCCIHCKMQKANFKLTHSNASSVSREKNMGYSLLVLHLFHSATKQSTIY